MMPVRIHRRRTKGWRMPAGAVYVGRGTRWGNPFTAETVAGCTCNTCLVASFQLALRGAAIRTIRRELRGKDLACWCRTDQVCHADALIELANDDAIYRYALERLGELADV